MRKGFTEAEIKAMSAAEQIEAALEVIKYTDYSDTKNLIFAAKDDILFLVSYIDNMQKFLDSRHTGWEKGFAEYLKNVA